MNEITLKEFAEIFKFIIENNRRLEDEGRKTTAVGLTGLPGLGKTMTIRQLAEELGMTCVVVRLSQIEEIGEISGFPIKEYEIKLIDIVKKIESEEFIKKQKECKCEYNIICY